MPTTTLEVILPRPHPKQQHFIQSLAKRKVVKVGRRGGKTVGLGIYAVQRFLAGKRILYAVPTQEQIDRFWTTCKRALQAPLEAGIYYKNETLHIIEMPGTEQRIRAKTAWNSDTLRGDYADELILDEYQLMSEDAWGLVGAPMMLDTNGNAAFAFTPPSLLSRSVSKAKDKKHALKMFQRAQEDTSGRWEAFHFTSHDNPYLSVDALEEIAQDMTRLAFRQEILAEDVDEVPGALWTPALFDATRVDHYPSLSTIVVGVDPHATVGETGIIVAGLGTDNHGYVLEDMTIGGSPRTWAGQVVSAFHKYFADEVIAESNNGGDMVVYTIETIDNHVPVRKVWASRGKMPRAAPIAARYEKGEVHNVGVLPLLEDECCSYVPGDTSPNRMDAMVWALTRLMVGAAPDWEIV